MKPNNEETQDTVIVTAPFPPGLAEAARIQAARLGISRSELIRLAVANYLEMLKFREVELENNRPNHA